jgi:hypothetical protein
MSILIAKRFKISLSKIVIFALLLWGNQTLNAQRKIASLNFLQLGLVPETVEKKGKNISTSGLSFNLVTFGEKKFFRMDATWLMRYLMNG